MDQSAEKDQTQAPAVTPEVKSGPKGSKMTKGVKLALAIGIPVLLVLGTLSLAAANQGKDNFISRATSFLPVEKIPLINSIGKSDSEMLRDALAKQVDPAEMKSLGGMESKASAKIDAQLEAQGQKATMSLNMSGTIATSKDNSKAKGTIVVGGNVNAGVMNLDLGTEGFKGNFLMPSDKIVYLSATFSDQLSSSLDAAMKAYSQQMGTPAVNLKDISGKFGKLDLSTLSKDLGMSQVEPKKDGDKEKVKKATEELMNALRPDLLKLYGDTVGNFEKYSTVSNQGRNSVNGKSAITYGVKVDEDKAPAVFVDFIDGLGKLVNDHKSDLEKYCKVVEEEAGNCTAERAESFEPMSNEEKEEAKKSFDKAFDQIDFNDYKFYVSPVDNTLLKSEGTIVITEEGLKALNASSPSAKYTSLKIYVSGEEVSRGNDVTIDEPKAPVDLNKAIKNLLDGYTKGLMSGSQNLTMPSGTKPNLDDLNSIEGYDFDFGDIAE